MHAQSKQATRTQRQQTELAAATAEVHEAWRVCVRVARVWLRRAYRHHTAPTHTTLTIEPLENRTPLAPRLPSLAAAQQVVASPRWSTSCCARQFPSMALADGCNQEHKFFYRIGIYIHIIQNVSAVSAFSANHSSDSG